MTENKTPHVLSEKDRAFILDPDTPARLLKDVMEIKDETAHLVHEFTHIGDSNEHDPLRVRIGFDTIDAARFNVERIFEVLEHPEIPEEIKAVRRQLLAAMAIAGQVALDLRNAENNWDEVVALNTPQGGSSAAAKLLLAIFDATPPAPEDDKS